MLYNKTLSIFLLMFISCQIFCGTIFDINFKQGEKIPWQMNSKSWKISEGQLKSVGRHFSEFDIKNLSLTNFSLETKMRFYEKIKNDNHSGFIFEGTNATVRVYFRTGMAAVWITKNGKTTIHKSIYKYPEAWKTSNESKWNSIKLIVKDQHAELDINGAFSSGFDFPVNKVNQIKVYSGGINCAFENIKLLSVNEDRKNESKAPREVFHAKFDDSLDASGPANKVITPSVNKNVKFVKGLSGKAVYIGGVKKGDSKLCYPVQDIFAGDSGCLMFWFQPDWDGYITDRKNIPNYVLLMGNNEQEKRRINMAMWHWLRCDLGRKGGESLHMGRRCRKSWHKGDWIHVAVVWNEDGWNKLFINGRSSPQGYWRAFVKYDFPCKANVFLKDIKDLWLGSYPGKGYFYGARGAFDEFKIFNNAVSDEFIVSEYRKFMPVDIYNATSFVNDSVSKLELRVAPGGVWYKPNPLKKDISAYVEISMSLVEEKTHKVISEKDVKMDVQDKQSIFLPVNKLSDGTYELKARVKTKNGTFQKSFSVVCYKQKPLEKASNQDVEPNNNAEQKIILPLIKNKIISNRNIEQLSFKGVDYIQASKECGSRFAFEVSIPEKYVDTNKPVILEVVWPDNIPRSMALYMYVESKRAQHRDRLSGGIQSGYEYPLTHKMVRTRYLFWPGSSKYLFEARTIIKDMPAAVAQVNVIPLEEELPRLKINKPKNLQVRALGHHDEDQTFDVMLSSDKSAIDAGKFYPIKVIDRLCDYYAYTGQSVLSYSMMRYTYSLLSTEGFSGNTGLLVPGVFKAFLDIMGHYDMKFIGNINQHSYPEISAYPEKEDFVRKQNLYMENKDGTQGEFTFLSSLPHFDPSNPLVRKLFLGWFNEILERYGAAKAFKGIEVHVRHSWSFYSLDYGYGDYTINNFSRDTGIKLPKSNMERYKLLTGKYFKQWLKWRSSKVFDIIEDMSKLAHKINPNLKVYLMVSGQIYNCNTPDDYSFKRGCYEKCGLDIDRINTLSNVVIVATRPVGRARWVKHRKNTETTYESELYSFERWNRDEFSKSVITKSFLPYYEARTRSLNTKVYNSYFQNADVKPWGRYFLKEWAWCLGMLDSDIMLIGGQPLGTSGRDEVTREFSQAFCALPAMKFKSVQDASDPVTVRYLKTKNGTYFYAVNLLWSDVNCKLTFAKDVVVEDLSTGKKYKSQDKSLEINLKTYQLRSFLIKDASIEVESCKTTVPDSTVKFLKDRFTLIINAIDKLKKSNIDIQESYLELVKKAEKLFQAQKYATLHQLLFSKPANLLINNLKDFKLLAEQNRMICQNKYAINCGGSYCRLADGTLLFPDKEYTGEDFGHSKQFNSVTRDISKLKNPVEDNKLFETEAYDLDFYKFKVKPGIYKVKMFFKVGYKPKAKPGIFVFDLSIEGKKVLDDFDVLRACNNDFDASTSKTFNNVKVVDGTLDINFSVPKGSDSTVRLCNAIIVEKVK